MRLQELDDRRTLCLGLWALVRHGAGRPFDAVWADAAIADAEVLYRRETWAVAGHALNQDMTSGDRARAAACADRLGAYRAPRPSILVVRGDETLLSQWRVATVHRWLLVGEALNRQRRSGAPVTREWLSEGSGASTCATPACVSMPPSRRNPRSSRSARTAARRSSRSTPTAR